MKKNIDLFRGKSPKFGLGDIVTASRSCDWFLNCSHEIMYITQAEWNPYLGCFKYSTLPYEETPQEAPIKYWEEKNLQVLITNNDREKLIIKKNDIKTTQTEGEKMTNQDRDKAIKGIESALKIVRAKAPKSEAYKLLVHAKLELALSHE